MWKRFSMAFLAFWLGVALALVAWAVFSFKVGLVVFAIGLLATVVLIAWGIRIGRRKVIEVGRELDERAQARNAAGTGNTIDGTSSTTGPATAADDIWPPEFTRERRPGDRW